MDDPARKRFFAIALIRLAGVAQLMLGMLVMAGALDWSTGVGVGLLMIGLFDFAVMPVLLARHWRTPPK